jgi:hypothetical protein
MRENAIVSGYGGTVSYLLQCAGRRGGT